MLLFFLGVPALIASTRFHSIRCELRFSTANDTYSLWTKPGGLTKTFRDPGPDFGDFSLDRAKDDCGLVVESIGADGSAYLVACLPAQHNSGGTPGVAEVFGYHHGRLVPVAKLASNQMFDFPSLAPGRRVIARSFEIGMSLAHSQEPRWQEFFVVRNSRLTPVTHSSRLYRPWLSRLWRALLFRPDEPECWHYYGVAAQRSGTAIRPKDAYRRMLRQRTRWRLPDSNYSESDPANYVEWLKDQIKLNKWPADATSGVD